MPNITGYSRRRWGRDEEEDIFEVVEVFDRDLVLSDWRRPDDGEAGFHDFPFSEEELCPPDAFDDLTPDEQHFHEATGNEGASFERTYRRAGLVLWPAARRLAVLTRAGLGTTLPYLEALTARWEAGDPVTDSPLWREATSFRDTCCVPGPGRYGARRAIAMPAGCSTCRSGWAIRRVSTRFLPSCRPKAITRPPITRRSCAPWRFFRGRVQRSCWPGSSDATRRSG